MCVCVFNLCVEESDSCMPKLQEPPGVLEEHPGGFDTNFGTVVRNSSLLFVCVFLFIFFLFSLFLLIPILAQQVMCSKFNRYKRDLEAQCVCVCVSKSTLGCPRWKKKIFNFYDSTFIFPPSPKDCIFRLANRAGETLTLTNCLL